MANRHINKGNEPICASGIDNSNSGILPCYSCYSAILDDKSELNQRVKGKSACYWVLLFVLFLEARTDKSQLNQQVNTKTDRAIPSQKPAKLDESQEPALDFIDGQIAKARHTLQLCRDDLRAKRQSLQLCHDRFGLLMLKLKQGLERDMEGLHYKLDELNLAEGLTPARRGKVGQPRKGFQHSKDYLRAAMMLSIDDGYHERTGRHISSKAEAIRVCQQVERILTAEGAMDSEVLFDKDAATLQRSIRDGLKHFAGQDLHWDRLKKS